MPKQRKPAHAEIDWESAEVQGGKLRVELAGEPTAAWAKDVEETVERLDRSTGRWDAIKVSSKQITVGGVSPGAEADLRHLLEGAVQQANANHAPEPEDEGDHAADETDRAMTEAFRAFGG